MTSDHCNWRPLEICFLHLANECFAATVIGKPFLRWLKGDFRDDVFHHGVDFLFSHWLDFVPNFIARSSVVFYREIKCRDHSSWDWEAYGWCTGDLDHFGLKLSWFCVQTSRSGFRWPSSSANSANSRPSSPFMILKSSSLILWCSCLPRRPNCWVSSQHIVWIKDSGVLPPSFSLFQRISSSSSDSRRACRGQPREAVSLFRPVLVCRNWILCREQWIGYILCISSVCQVMQSLFSGFLVRNPHHVCRSSKVLSSADS